MMPAESDVIDHSFARIVRRLPEIYLTVALLVSTALCLLTPPFYVPDESNHAQREIEISQGELIAKRTAEGVGAPMDVGLLSVVQTMHALYSDMVKRHPVPRERPDGSVTEAQLAPLRQIRWTHRMTFSSFLNTAVYPPLLYVPQALGWRLGEAADLTIMHTLLLSRLFAAVCAVAIGWCALRLCGAGRWLLFAYLLLPTLLSLNASCSQDAILLTLAGLAMVLLARAISAGRLLTLSELVVVAGVLTICIGARPPYLPFALALLLPALEARGIRWQQFIPSVLGVVLIAGVIGAWQLQVHPLGIAVYPGIQPESQVAFLRAHPVRGGINLMEGTILALPAAALKGLALLGTLDVAPPKAVYAVLLLGVAGVGWFAPKEGLNSWRARGVLLFILLTIVVAISLAEYIIWTPLAAKRIEGLQFRYYLPLIPFAFLLLPGNLRLQAASESAQAKPCERKLFCGQQRHC
jgi:uncharacterized membrane protein